MPATFPLQSLTAHDNRVFNGDFLIDQRFNATTSTPAATAYVMDGWKLLLTQASKLSFVQSATSPPTSFIKSGLITVAANFTPGVGDAFIFAQQIEGLVVADVGMGTSSAQNMILSFWQKSSVAGTYAASLRNNAGNRSYVATYSIPTAATWTYIVLSIPGDTTGTWLQTNGIGISLGFDMGSGSNFQTTVGAWAAGNFTSASGTVQLVNNVAATSNITNVRLRTSNTDAPYIPRPYSVELQFAQRYYENTFNPGTTPAQSAGVVGALTVKNPIAAGDPALMWTFRVPKRATPTAITTYNPSAANANWRNITQSADATVSVDPQTTLGVNGVVIATSATVAALGDILAIHAAAEAGL